MPHSARYKFESSTRFPSLQSATFEPLSGDGEVEVNYRSGAYFKGQVQDYKRIGRGIFSWPNGARYEGDYVDNVRTGSGIQHWPEGSKYEGEFNNDLRHGEGHHMWANQESYNGKFVQDRRHGPGTYTWPDGSSYTGTFYMDRKEGYGVFQFANGNVFEGLYKEDEREGPGVITYAEGTQDVGLWHGEKLVKICSSIPEAFTMKVHPEFDFNPEEHTLYISTNDDLELVKQQAKDLIPSLENCNNNVANKHENMTEKVTKIFNVSLDPRSLAVNKELFDNAFFQIENGNKIDSEKILAWNKTPSMIDMQKHVHKHRGSKKNVSFDVDAIFNGDRSTFKEKGPLEQVSEQLMIAATHGNWKTVEDLLTSGKLSPDVADKNGHTPLVGATVNWHIDVINCLLNHGADVNKLTDEGCSALSAGSIFFYPVESFHYNIAERYLDKPPHCEKTKKISENPSSQHVQQQPKGILTNKQTGSKKIAPDIDDKTAEKGQKPDFFDKHGSNRSIDSIPQENQSLKISPRLQGTRKSDINKQVTLKVEEDSHDQETEEELERLAKLEAEKEEFDSAFSLKYYPIEISDQLIERCATNLSMNEKVVGGQRADSSASLGTVRHLAVIKNERERMKQTLDLLLRRGANPNASGVPMPVLFFAIKAADTGMVQALLSKGASTSITLPKEKGGLAPLHISVAIPGEEGVQITQLLLNAGADPDVRAGEDDSFLNNLLIEEWSKDTISPESQELLGGRTPLQIACARDDNYKVTRTIIKSWMGLKFSKIRPGIYELAALEHLEKSQRTYNGRNVVTTLVPSCLDGSSSSLQNSTKVIRLLLEHKADTDLLCNGFSALALCIASGNDAAIDELLVFGNDTSLALTHGVGSALCAATNTEYEYRRSINGRIQLIDKLIQAGANILAPIPIGPKRLIGSAVDYAHYMFQQDTRIARTPYHALTPSERDTFNNRRRLLAHVGHIFRNKAVERERRRLLDEQKAGSRSASPSSAFVYIGAGAQLPPDARRPKFLRNQPTVTGDGPIVKFEGSQQGLTSVEASEAGERWDRTQATGPSSYYVIKIPPKSATKPRKPLFKYCYECGRAVNVSLTACTRCKEVYYCGKPCKLKAWNARHKQECIRIGGRSRSPSPSGRRKRAESPTPATHPDKGKKTTVAELTKDKRALRIHPEEDVESLTGILNELGIDVDNIEKKGSSRKGSSRKGSSRKGSSRPLSTHSSLQECSIKSFEVPRKGLSHSAMVAGRYGANDPRRVKSDLQQDVYYNENYSFN